MFARLRGAPARESPSLRASVTKPPPFPGRPASSGTLARTLPEARASDFPSARAASAASAKRRAASSRRPCSWSEAPSSMSSAGRRESPGGSMRALSPAGLSLPAGHRVRVPSARPTRDALPRASPARSRRRRPAPARLGSGEPARGGSRGSPRTRPARSPSGRSSQPAKRSCSSARASFGSAVVRGVADQDVAEAEALLAGGASSGRGGSSSLRTSVVQVPRRRAARARSGASSRDRAAVKDLALDRRPLDARALARAEPVEPRRERAPGSSAARDRLEVAGRAPSARLAREQAVVDEHREHLLDEERVALGGRDDPRSHASARARPARAGSAISSAALRRRRAARAAPTSR